MSKSDNLHDYLSDLADAIREKKGSSEPINAQNFAEEIKGISTGGWTGHADAEGLKAIGWDDDDIAYYQKHGVNWNEEDDEYHKVSDDNKALYGVLTADNIANYKDRIVYLPKIDTSGLTSMSNMFVDCKSMVAIPMLNTTNVKNMLNTFQNCYILTCIPPLDTSNVTNMAGMFNSCYALTCIPPLDTSNVTNMNMTFRMCYSLLTIPKLNTSKVTNMGSCFYSCQALVGISELETTKVSNAGSTFSGCLSLTNANLRNLNISISFGACRVLSKASLLYIINNEAATSDITITLYSYAYSRLAEDADVVSALANHPLISLASA